MLFQGQEFARAAPFLYFADHQARAARARAQAGAREFLAQFPTLAPAERERRCPIRPTPRRSRAAKLDSAERDARTAGPCALHRDLLRAAPRRTRRSGPGERGARRRRRARPRRLRAALLRGRGRRRPAAAREPRPRPAPAPGARAAAGAARGHALGACAGRARTALRRAGRRRAGRTTEAGWLIAGARGARLLGTRRDRGTTTRAERHGPARCAWRRRRRRRGPRRARVAGDQRPRRLRLRHGRRRRAPGATTAC